MDELLVVEAAQTTVRSLPEWHSKYLHRCKLVLTPDFSGYDCKWVFMGHMSHNDTSRIPSSVSFDALLRYNELETQRWRDWFLKQPDAVLDLAAGDPKMEMATTRDLLFHIFIVEWVYAKVLNGEAWENEWQKFDRKTRAGIFAVAEEAQPELRAFAESASAAQLAQHYTITSRGGTVRGTGVKFLTHVVFHSTRHWAQMAMLMRQQGYPTGWHHDLVLSDAME